jgi:Arabinose efflux permease
MSHCTSFVGYNTMHNTFLRHAALSSFTFFYHIHSFHFSHSLLLEPRTTNHHHTMPPTPQSRKEMERNGDSTYTGHLDKKTCKSEDGGQQANQTPCQLDEQSFSPTQKGLLRSVNPVHVLPVLNMLDMLSVSLVVPLLNQYYKDSGVTSASLREFLNSLFSTSQILGSIVMGIFSDCGLLSRKHILYLSFLGSALSYTLLVYGGIKAMVASRVIVGAVKQTNTISTAMLVSHTTSEERSRHIARLNAYSKGAFIIGPSVGGYLYKHIGPRAPALLAAILFLVNFIIASLLLPSDDDIRPQPSECSHHHKNSKASNNSKFSSFIRNFKSSFATKDLGSVVICTLIYHWILRATSYASMASYYEEMFGIESHQRGYLTTYQTLVSFVFQTFLLQFMLRHIGGEYNAVCIAAGSIAIATTLELGANFYLFLIVICPVVGVANTTLQISLRSILTQVTPKESLGSVLAAMDVMQNAASVSVPFYRTVLFRIMECTTEENPHAAMVGDPCPIMWLKSSILHWTLATLVMSHLLLRTGLLDKKKQA